MKDGRRLRQWEFWPFWAFYAPVYGHLFASALRNRSFPHFCCANPGIRYGGLLEYSKQSLMDPLPAHQVPVTRVIPLDTSPESALRTAKEAGIGFPMILKPDMGERGFFVEKIDDEVGLRSYLAQSAGFLALLRDAGRDTSAERLLLQSYVPEREEFGVMWVHDPRWSAGRITSIVHKRLLSVTGDGESTLGELISAHERARFHETMLRERYASELHRVVPRDEEMLLVEIGNHARGATFLDATSAADEALRDVIAPLAAAIPGFHLGRFDIRAASFEALRAGKFRVIEVNGVNSEPAHIYDPRNSLRKAYGDLLTHWRLVESVARANREAGCEPPRFRELLDAVRRHGSRQKIARSFLDRGDRQDETPAIQ